MADDLLWELLRSHEFQVEELDVSTVDSRLHLTVHVLLRDLFEKLMLVLKGTTPNLQVESLETLKGKITVKLVCLLAPEKAVFSQHTN